MNTPSTSNTERKCAISAVTSAHSQPACVKDPQGNLLDGEWRNPGGPGLSDGDRFPSGDGTAGGDFRFRINVLAGDTERDGIELARDYSEVKRRFFSSADGSTTGSAPYSLYHDTDGSGIILARDYSEVKKRFFNTLPVGEPTGFSSSLVRREDGANMLPA